MRDKKFLLKAYKHIQDAYKPISRDSYEQEPCYISAIMGRLNGTLKSKNGGTLQFKFKTVIVNDRGPSSAEKKYGADFAIVFEKTGVECEVSKAVIGQAKNEFSNTLPKKEKNRLIQQCEKMYSHTTQYIVIEAPKNNDKGPMVRIGDPDNPLKIGKRISLEHYILNELVGCMHGDRRSNFIEAVQESSLAKLEIITNGLDLDLDLDLDNSPTFEP